MGLASVTTSITLCGVPLLLALAVLPKQWLPDCGDIREVAEGLAWQTGMQVRLRNAPNQGISSMLPIRQEARWTRPQKFEWTVSRSLSPHTESWIGTSGNCSVLDDSFDNRALLVIVWAQTMAGKYESCAAPNFSVHLHFNFTTKYKPCIAIWGILG